MTLRLPQQRGKEQGKKYLPVPISYQLIALRSSKSQHFYSTMSTSRSKQNSQAKRGRWQKLEISAIGTEI
jgi:hypothetical protein